MYANGKLAMDAERDIDAAVSRLSWRYTTTPELEFLTAVASVLEAKLDGMQMRIKELEQ